MQPGPHSSYFLDTVHGIPDNTTQEMDDNALAGSSVATRCAMTLSTMCPRWPSQGTWATQSSDMTIAIVAGAARGMTRMYHRSAVLGHKSNVSNSKKRNFVKYDDASEPRSASRARLARAAEVRDWRPVHARPGTPGQREIREGRQGDKQHRIVTDVTRLSWRRSVPCSMERTERPAKLN